MTLYEILGVKPDAMPAEITAAYRKLAMKHHPDRKGGDKEKFQEIQKAYEVLTNHESRARYDATGAYDKTPTLTEQAINELQALFVQLIDSHPEDINFRLEMENVIQANVTACESQKAGIVSQNKKYAKVMAKLKGKANFLQRTLDARISRGNVEITREDAKLKLLAEMKKILQSGYEYNDSPYRQRPEIHSFFNTIMTQEL